ELIASAVVLGAFVDASELVPVAESGALQGERRCHAIRTTATQVVFVVTKDVLRGELEAVLYDGRAAAGPPVAALFRRAGCIFFPEALRAAQDGFRLTVAAARRV